MIQRVVDFAALFCWFFCIYFTIAVVNFFVNHISGCVTKPFYSSTIDIIYSSACRIDDDNIA
jgi:hypothetical protein